MNGNAQKGPLGPRLSVNRDAIFTLLKQLAFDHEVFFRRNGASNYGLRIADCCQEISTSVYVLKDLVKQLKEAAHRCDYDEKTPGNGFRSLICVCDKIILHLVSVLRICSENRSTLTFRAHHYCKEVEGYTAVIRFLVLSFQQLVAGLPMLDKDSLFPPLDSHYAQYNSLLKSIESLDSTCFYARPLGFQFCPSVTRIFYYIGIILATFSLTWEKDQTSWNALFKNGRQVFSLLSSEQRAARIVKVIREADIEFCRGFWNLSELPGNVPKLIDTLLPMAICELREIPLCGPLPLETNKGEIVLVPEPSAHTGPRPVSMRVLSSSHREGLSPVSIPNKLPKSPYLVIHCHGGGYVATSSKSHETYLRAWAKSLNCPVISIDYSLSPENPFPRPTEEVMYAYTWILNNSEKIGWTGKKVVMCGDSAGGNLVVSACLRLLDLNAKRLPDGIVPMYTPFLFQYLPSPSRVLSFMDPLLHMGVVIRCAAAYTGAEPGGMSQVKTSTPNEKTSNGHKSLQEYVDEVQKAQKNNILDFSKGSQAIISLVNLSQSRTSMFANSSSSDSGHISESSMKRIKSEANNTIDSEDIWDEDAILDEGLNNTQTVHIDGDPDNICLTSTHFDPDLIDYLQVHPLTKRSLQVSCSDEAIESDREAEEDFVLGEAPPATPQEFANKLSGLPEEFESPAPIPKSATMGFVNFFSTTPTRNTTSMLDEGNELRQPLSAKLSNRSPFKFPPNGFNSAGPKRPLTRNTRSLSQSIADTLVDKASLAYGHVYDNITDWFETPSTPIGSADKRKLTRAVTLTPMVAAKLEQEESEDHESAFTELLKLTLPRDHLISPMYTSDDILRRLPPCWFVACHLDPLLDDTIMFAKKLRDAGGQVKCVELLDDLPHGFLNFSMVSTDCKNGANTCLKYIKEALNFETST